MKVYEAIYDLKKPHDPLSLAPWLLCLFRRRRGDGDVCADLPVGIANEVRYAGVPVIDYENIAVPVAPRWDLIEGCVKKVWPTGGEGDC